MPTLHGCGSSPPRFRSLWSWRSPALGLRSPAPGGLGPPEPQTPSGEAISRLYWIVFAICAVVFVLVESALIYFIVRFRRRRDTPEGRRGPADPRQHPARDHLDGDPGDHPRGDRDLHLHADPGRPGRGVEDEEHLTIRVEAHQFYWEYRYPGGEVSVDTLYLPVDEPVELELTSLDVVHSWWVPSLTGKMDAIPGRMNTLRFVPETVGDVRGKVRRALRRPARRSCRPRSQVSRRYGV